MSYCNLCKEIHTNKFIWLLEGYAMTCPAYIKSYCCSKFLYGYDLDVVDLDITFERRLIKLIHILLRRENVATMLQKHIQDLSFVKTCKIVKCEDFCLYLYLETTSQILCYKRYESNDEYNDLPLSRMGGADFMGVPMAMRGLLNLSRHKSISDFIHDTVRDAIFDYLNKKFYVDTDVGRKKYNKFHYASGCLKGGKIYNEICRWR